MIRFIHKEFNYAMEVMRDEGRQSYAWVLPYIRNNLINHSVDTNLLSKDRKAIRKRIEHLENRPFGSVSPAVRTLELEELDALRKVLAAYKGVDGNA